MATRSITVSVPVSPTAAVSAVLNGPTASQFRDKDRYLRVTNLDGVGTITFRIDGTTAVAHADEAYVVAKVAGADVMIPVNQVNLPVTLSLIATTGATLAHCEIVAEADLPEARDT